MSTCNLLWDDKALRSENKRDKKKKDKGRRGKKNDIWNEDRQQIFQCVSRSLRVMRVRAAQLKRTRRIAKEQVSESLSTTVITRKECRKSHESSQERRKII